MMNFKKALIYLKGSKDMVARQIWEDKALMNYKGEVMLITLSTGVRHPFTLFIGDTDAKDWSVVRTAPDPTYDPIKGYTTRGVLQEPLVVLTPTEKIVIPKGCTIEFSSSDNWEHNPTDKDIEDGAKLLSDE